MADGEVFLRYGYVSGKNPPVIIPSSVIRETVRDMDTDGHTDGITLIS